MNKLIIGICGPKTVGKSYLAKRFKQLLNKNKVNVVSFATPIKEEIGYSDDKEVLRKEYQKYGDKMRSENPEHFVDIVLDKINKSNSNIVILDDVRYQNEADICEVLIELTADNITYTNEHTSESGGLMSSKTLIKWQRGFVSDEDIRGLVSSLSNFNNKG